MIFDSNWKPEYLGNEPLAGTIYEKVSLSSGNTDLGFHRINIWINASTHFPEKIVTLDRRQTEIPYEFTNLSVDQNLPESTFVFHSSSFQEIIWDEWE